MEGANGEGAASPRRPARYAGGRGGGGAAGGERVREAPKMEGAWKGSRRRRSAGVSQPATGARAGAVRAQPWRLRSLALPAPRTRRSQTKGGLTRWRRERASQPANSPTHPPTLPPRAGGRGRPGPAGSARRGRGGARRPPHLSGPGPGRGLSAAPGPAGERRCEQALGFGAL